MGFLGKAWKGVKSVASDPLNAAAVGIGAATGGWALPIAYNAVKGIAGSADKKASNEYAKYREEQAKREAQRQELIAERQRLGTEFESKLGRGLGEVRGLHGSEAGTLGVEQAYWNKYREMPSKSIAEMLLQKQAGMNARGMLGAAAAAGGRGGNQMRAMREAQMGGERTMSDAYTAQGMARVQEENSRQALAAQASAGYL